MSCRQYGLGDIVEQALATVGITERLVSRWLNRPCGCEERKQRLNDLGCWATRVLRGKGSQEQLQEIMQ